MSNYRDTVREMMRDLKRGKEFIPKEAPDDAVATGASTSNDAIDNMDTTSSELPVPNEEELFDDILDLEEGGPAPLEVDDEEAEKLLSDSSRSTTPSPSRSIPEPPGKRLNFTVSHAVGIHFLKELLNTLDVSTDFFPKNLIYIHNYQGDYVTYLCYVVIF